jgi:hypothetical protein
LSLRWCRTWFDDDSLNTWVETGIEPQAFLNFRTESLIYAFIEFVLKLYRLIYAV